MMIPKQTNMPVKGAVLTVDPGLRCCGVAVWSPAGRLVRAGLAVNQVTKDRGPVAWAGMGKAAGSWWSGTLSDTSPYAPPALLLVERQVIQYGRTRNPADILELAGAAGAVVGQVGGEKVAGYFDIEWKGTIQGDAMTEMIRRRIQAEPSEHRNIEWSWHKALEHNILDAIGMGLFFFDRLVPKRVIHR